MALPDLIQGVAFPQTGHGLYRIRIAAEAGDLPSSVAIVIGELARDFGNGEVRMTLRHELEIVGIPEPQVETVADRVRSLGLRCESIEARPNVVACPGADHCSSAFVHTKSVCRALEALLRDAAGVGPLPLGFRVAVAGCPNECSHTSINDVGFVGSIGVYGGRKLKGVELLVGGSTEGDGRLGERIAFVTSDDIVPTLRDLIEIYRETKAGEQSFAQFYEQMGQEELTRLLYEKLNQRMWFFEI